MRRFCAALGFIALTACAAPVTPAPDTDMLAIGDSILRWHRGTGGSIPTRAAQGAGLTVANRAVVGATFLGLGGIPSQYVAGDWDYVLLDGGGNDIFAVCGTPTAKRVLNALIGAGADTGAMTDFVQDLAANGHHVLLLGYYPVGDNGGPFAKCTTELKTLRARQRALAARTRGVTFIDPGQVIQPTDVTAYDRDLVHPSRRGATLIGALIATKIREF